MPEYSNTLKNLSLKICELGKVKIGLPGRVNDQGKRTAPTKLGHFLITTMEKTTDGQPMEDRELMAILGPAPKELDIFLFTDSIEDSFKAYRAWIGKPGILCRGDNEQATRTHDLDKNGQPVELPEPVSLACPCERARRVGDNAPTCKPHGKLVFMLKDAQQIGGCYVFRTTSWNTINSISAALAMISSLTQGILAMIPLRMVILQKAETVAGRTQKIPVVTVVFPGGAEQLLDAAARVVRARERSMRDVREIGQQTRLLLDAPEDLEEIRAEFLPETIGATEPAAPHAPAPALAPENQEASHFSDRPDFWDRVAGYGVARGRVEKALATNYADEPAFWAAISGKGSPENGQKEPKKAGPQAASEDPTPAKVNAKPMAKPPAEPAPPAPADPSPAPRRGRPPASPSPRPPAPAPAQEPEPDWSEPLPAEIAPGQRGPRPRPVQPDLNIPTF
jgi:hypothetical protein